MTNRKGLYALLAFVALGVASLSGCQNWPVSGDSGGAGHGGHQH